MACLYALRTSESVLHSLGKKGFREEAQGKESRARKGCFRSAQNTQVSLNALLPGRYHCRSEIMRLHVVLFGILFHSVKDRPAAKKEEGPSSASSPPPTVEDPQARMEKEARKLRKKIRECDALVEKQKKGESLTEQEQEKLRKLITW